ncbi:MAG: ADP-glyceromanno-heptose 6-epimerase, partial [Chitinophagaceae bacterium]
MGSIVVTGAAGFIGSCLVSYLNQQGLDQLILVDDFSRKDKEANLLGKRFQQRVDRMQFFEWLSTQQPELDFFFHIGARTDTTEFRYAVHQELNVYYSQQVWNYCTQQNIPLVYASSAATYGSGELGYDDDLRLLPDLKPLNPYGESKQEFDQWVLHQEDHPPFWAGLKFFNVYGPNEYHKGRMASVIWHAFRQIREQGVVQLFRSHRSDFRDGEQLRDFIYVKDVLTVCDWFFQQWRSAAPATSSIYNLGTGQARTFNDLVGATFKAMG